MYMYAHTPATPPDALNELRQKNTSALIHCILYIVNTKPHELSPTPSSPHLSLLRAGHGLMTCANYSGSERSRDRPHLRTNYGDKTNLNITYPAICLMCFKLGWRMMQVLLWGHSFTVWLWDLTAISSHPSTSTSHRP